jgi:hypothetical protein
MGGTWATTTIFNNDSFGTTVGAQQVNRNLPTSNFIGEVTVKLHVVGTNTSTISLDFIRLNAAGNSTIISCEGGQYRGYLKYQCGSVTPGVAVAATDQVWLLTLRFGRGPHDEKVILPAKLYKQLQLSLQVTTAVAGVTALGITITADEYYSNDDPRTKFVKTFTLVQTTASAASQRGTVQLNRGRFLKAVYVHVDDSDNVSGNSPIFGGTTALTEPLRVRINNGAETPFEEALDMAKVKNQHTYRFDDADTPDSELTNAAAFAGTEEMVCFDFDVDDSLEHAVNTAAVNDITVTWVGAASGTSGDIHVLAEEVYPVVF